MNARQLAEAFHAWSNEQQDLVLATVYQTAGSTYSKAGAQMLIDADGNFQGMLSGGCLEGDLAERAADVLASGQPQAVTFDLGSNDDTLWGLGVGCDGLMRIFLQPLRATDGYQPFTAVLDVLSGDTTGALATVIASEDPAIAPGSAVLWNSGSQRIFGLPDSIAGQLLPALQAVQAPDDTKTMSLATHNGVIEILLACLCPPPRVLVLGGGLDAQPLVRLLNELGWRVTVQDHRSAYIAKGDFNGAERVVSMQPDALVESLDLPTYSAAVVMSHHLDTDRAYLQMLAETDMAYIGLLGPPARRDRLLDELGKTGEALRDRVHGPAGLDIGGRGPASIAVSIVAEMHRQLLKNAS